MCKAPRLRGLCFLNCWKYSPMIINITDGPLNAPEGKSRNELIIENEILMMKLSAEFGAKIYLPDSRTDPGMENRFLKMVYGYEKRSSDGSRQTLLERLGNPDLSDYIVADKNDYDQLWLGLKSFLCLHKIVIDHHPWISPKQLFEFVTEELFSIEANFPDDENCVVHFDYDEFHDDPSQELRQLAHWFVNYLANDLDVADQCGLYSRVRTSSGMIIGYKEAARVIDLSFSEFVSRQLLTLNIEDIVIDDNKAEITIDVSYEAEMKDGEKLRISGQGWLHCVYSDDNWWVYEFRFPGIVI